MPLYTDTGFPIAAEYTGSEAAQQAGYYIGKVGDEEIMERWGADNTAIYDPRHYDDSEVAKQYYWKAPPSGGAHPWYVHFQVFATVTLIHSDHATVEGCHLVQHVGFQQSGQPYTVTYNDYSQKHSAGKPYYGWWFADMPQTESGLSYRPPTSYNVVFKFACLCRRGEDC